MSKPTIGVSGTIPEEITTQNTIRRTVTKILIPFIQLYGLYVIAHGELGPGGG